MMRSAEHFTTLKLPVADQSEPSITLTDQSQVILTLWSLLGSLFGLGLALGVVIAVGMLLVFQVSCHQAVIKLSQHAPRVPAQGHRQKPDWDRGLDQGEGGLPAAAHRDQVHLALRPREARQPRPGPRADLLLAGGRRHRLGGCGGSVAV